MRHLKQKFVGLLLSVSILVGCSSSLAPTNPPSPAQNPFVPSVTPKASLLPPSATPEATSTSTRLSPSATPERIPTSTATSAPMTAGKEENGWVTYRNEVIGYEISVPNSYQIKGASPELGLFRHGLLGPAVPDEEIVRLVSKYYGSSLWVWMSDIDANGQLGPAMINIMAYDIIVKDLGGSSNPGGMGDYQLTHRQETLHIDWHTYPVNFTIGLRDNQPVGELAVLYLEKDGIEFMFGYVQPEDNPEAYQTYLKEDWPELRKIIETYKKLPEETSMVGIPSVNAASLKDASPRAIAQVLFEQYLMAFQNHPMDPQTKLISYQIEEVEIPEKWQPCAELNKVEFIAVITFSVKPELWPPPSQWTSDGYLTYDHRIVRKKAYIAVFRSDQDYKMEILDIPVCPGFK